MIRLSSNMTKRLMSVGNVGRINRKLANINVFRSLLTIRQAPSLTSHHSLKFSQFSTNETSTATNEVAPASEDIFSVELPTNANNPNLLKIRHSTSHVLAMAVQKLFPHVQVTIGPWIEDGFYYDFFVPKDPLSVEDFKKIKKEMDRIISKNLPFIREEVTREDARARILANNEPYKLELLDSIKGDNITIYHCGTEWWDLCAGPHVASTGDLNRKSIELMSIAGAYWRGDEKKPQLQRIYGTAWETPEQLKVHKLRLEEAKRRDHRTIGKNLNLFSIQEDAGGGLVFWHPKGSIIRRIIEDYWKQQHIENGYQILHTPHIANLNLWKTSGHFDFYREDMFKPMSVDEEEYQLKPMNCPFHCLMFKDTPKSYRDLPIRWAELGTVYRYEKSGSLQGLFRVRGFTQDDAHIFCLPSQLETEIVSVLSLVEKILNKFNFLKFDIMLSTKPKESVGSDEIWEKATNALIGALEKKNWSYTVDEGGGAFYGPKIDIKIRDAIGRKWQCSTIQCDFNLPERFDLEYTSNELKKLRPIMVHRAIFGSIERFFGVLIENTAGEFPLWMAPVQLRLLPVVDEVTDYCYQLKAMAEKEGIRVEIDTSGNRLGKLVRNAEIEKIPYTAVIGVKERDTNTLSLRGRKAVDLGAMDALLTLQKLRKSIENNEDFVA